MKKSIKLIVLSLFTLIFISGCSFSLDNKSNDAKTYLKEKYGINKNVKSWNCISYDDTLDNCSKNSIYYFDDGIEVYYDSNRNEFQDNYEAKEIIKDAEVFFNNFLATLGNVKLTKGDQTYKVTFNTNIKGNSYFHEKYDGNIEEYARKGGLIPKLSAGFVITTKGDYNRLLRLTQSYAGQYFQTNYITLFFLTDGLYNQNVFPDTNSSECFAKYVNGTIYTQNYVELVGGLSVSSNVPTIYLSGEDVRVLNENAIIGTVSEETGEEITAYDNYVTVFNELLQDIASRNNTEYIPAKPIGDAIYKIKFSNDLKSRIMATNSEKLNVYLRMYTGSKVMFYKSSDNTEAHGIQLNKNGLRETYVQIQDGDYIWFE